MSGRREGITALLCANSAWKAYLDVRGDPALAGIEAVRLPCTGTVETGVVLRLLERGSRGVLVLGCPKDNCQYQRGSHRAEARVGAARSALRDAGIAEGRVRMDFVSSVDGPKLLAAVRAFAAGLEEESAT